MARRASTESEPATNVNSDAVAACYSEYDSMMRDIRRMQYRMGTMFVKYEKSHGVDKKAVKSAHALAQKDPAEAERQDKRNREYAYIVGVLKVESDGQIALGDEIAPKVAMPNKATLDYISAKRALNDGYNSGLAGGSIDGSEKYPTGSEEFVAFRDGWEDGRRDRLERFPELENVTKAEPRPRGRPPGSKNKPKEVDQTDLEEHIVNAVQEAASVH